jgi:hypothetical protein
MQRYVVPVIFLVATAWLVWHNQSGGSVLVLPFVDVIFPDAAHKPDQMAARSAQILAAVTVGLWGLAIVEHFRDLRRQ